MIAACLRPETADVLKVAAIMLAASGALALLHNRP
jgi:hypothetical protein